MINLIQKINPKIDQVKIELENLHSYATQGAILRTKSQYFEMGESSTKYFFSLEKRNAKNKVMSSTFTDEGQLTMNSTEILTQQANYFCKLYTKDKKVCFDERVKPTRTLNEANKLELEKEITLEEIGTAISQMKHGKAPGIDGLPANFYKMFYCKIKFLLLEMLRECLKIKRLTPLARVRLISLIPKKEQGSTMD